MTVPNSDASAEAFKRALEHKFHGEYEEALQLLETMLLANPENIEAMEEVADNELSLGRYERASRAASEVLSLDSKSCNAHYILGFIASHEERWVDSIRSLSTANHLEPNDPEILRCLGWSLFSSGDMVEGLVTLERALNLEPDNPLTLCDLGVVHLRLKTYPKALALLERAREIDPENERVQECLEMARRIAEHVSKEA